LHHGEDIDVKGAVELSVLDIGAMWSVSGLHSLNNCPLNPKTSVWDRKTLATPIITLWRRDKNPAAPRA
jgi:hypothetical protein